MGREIRRVALDFDHPLGKVWMGFINPYSGYYKSCLACGHTGYNPATREIADTFYDNDGCGDRWHYRYKNGVAVGIIEKYPGACKRWMNKLTQDEVDALVESGRFNSQDWNEEKQQWEPKNPPVVVLAEELNKSIFPNYDACDRGLCIRVRAKRLGVYGLCPKCDGDGSIVIDPELKALSDNWQREDPPAGEGWQVWETVSEGSPITQVFATAEDLIDHLVNHGLNWGISKGCYSRQVAEDFVQSCWAPSGVGLPGKGFVDGITGMSEMKKSNG